MKGRPTNITSNVPAGRAAFSLIFIDFGQSFYMVVEQAAPTGSRGRVSGA